MVKYKDIEGLPNWPLDINNDKHQIVIKDFLWRSTEEMAESWEAFLDHKDPDHYLEEISDALHFIVETFIFSGTKVWVNLGNNSIEWYMDKEIKTLSETLGKHPKDKVDMIAYRLYIFDFWYRLGLVGNTLKNKPWKKSQVLTDKRKFSDCMNKMFISFLKMCCRFGLDADDLYNLYFKKAAVNFFRQRSNY